MTKKEFDNLKIGDAVVNSKKKISKVFDIDRRAGTLKVGHAGGGYRSYRLIKLPCGEQGVKP